MNLPNPPSALKRDAVVWLYLRYSSEHQTIESQEHALREWCALHGLTIGKIFADKAKSGKSDAGRDAFREMISLVERGDAANVAGVIIWSFARFARNETDAYFFKGLIRRAGLVLFSIADNIPDGEIAGVVEALKHFTDARYRERLAQEVKRGLEYRVSQGIPHTGNRPRLGYKRGERVYLGPRLKRTGGMLKHVGDRYGYKLAKDEKTRHRVETAWTMMLAGESDYQIWKATRVTCAHTAIGNFFNSVTYAGAVKCGDVVNWEAHAGYVTRDEWERVQSMRRERAPNPRISEKHPARRHNPDNFLSGLLRCGVCGGCLSYVCAGKTLKVLRCNHRYDVHGCTLRGILVETVHTAVLAWLAENVFTFERVRTVRDEIELALNGDADATAARRDEIAAHGKELDRVIANLIALGKHAPDVQEIAEQLQAAQTERTAVRRDLDALARQQKAQHLTVTDEALRWLVSEWQTVLHSDAAKEQLRGLVHATIQKMTLTAVDELDIEYSLEPVVAAAGNAILWQPSHWTGAPLNHATLPLVRVPAGRRPANAVQL